MTTGMETTTRIETTRSRRLVKLQPHSQVAHCHARDHLHLQHDHYHYHYQQRQQQQ
jgi:hypothetical protein